MTSLLPIPHLHLKIKEQFAFLSKIKIELQWLDSSFEHWSSPKEVEVMTTKKDPEGPAKKTHYERSIFELLINAGVPRIVPTSWNSPFLGHSFISGMGIVGDVALRGSANLTVDYLDIHNLIVTKEMKTTSWTMKIGCFIFGNEDRTSRDFEGVVENLPLDVQLDQFNITSNWVQGGENRAIVPKYRDIYFAVYTKNVR